MTKSDGDLPNIIKSCQEKIIYVDNSVIERKSGKELEANKKNRDESRKKVLSHLSKSCLKEVYKPEKLEKLSTEIISFMESKEKLKKELKELRRPKIASSKREQEDNNQNENIVS